MREILFRGQRKADGEWVEGSLLKVEHDGEEYCLIFGSDFQTVGGEMTAMSHALVFPESVAQFTGIVDRRGAKIFEGDRVLCYDTLDRPDGAGVVGWSELFCAWMLDGNQSMYGDSVASYEVWSEGAAHQGE